MSQLARLHVHVYAETEPGGARLLDVERTQIAHADGTSPYIVAWLLRMLVRDVTAEVDRQARAIYKARSETEV